MPEFAIGDRLTFRAATRWSDRKCTRKIVGIDAAGRPLVRFNGWSTFIVMPGEIIAVEPA